jgi:hypothetical protein
MAILTAIMTHLDAPLVRRQLDYLEALSPGSQFVICHGGAFADFEALDVDNAIFVDESSLRGPDRDRSHTEVILAVYERFVRDEPSVDLVYFIEYDHLILSADFEQKLRDLAGRFNAGLFAKNAIRRNDTNWPHFTRYRHDERLNLFFTKISRRDDPDARWGSLGNGMLFRRNALTALASVGDLPHAYVEMFIPTLTYHLGFDVVNVDAVSDLYKRVRWRPECKPEEAIREMQAGATFVHPFKDLAGLERVLAASVTDAASSATR